MASLSLIASGRIITNPYRHDGFGGHYQTIIYAAVYAELHNRPFFYTPIRDIEHNYHHDPDFIKKKEALMGFLTNFPLNEDLHLQSRMNRGGELFTFFANNVSACINTEVFQRIKSIFRIGKKKETYFDDRHLHIAIHIPRPNSHDNRSSGTDVPDCVYEKIIRSLRSRYLSENPLFHIYSQGTLDSFRTADIVLHLDEEIEETFSSMVFADVLVTAASSFSYVAGLLSDGIVYALPPEGPDLPQNLPLHPLPPHWIEFNLTEIGGF